MSHQQIIQTLIEWIDEHIDQPLNIDVVAKKSGYSKWYLQRMFRTVTHQTLGEYIRQRRLLLAAVELRTTERGFIDVPKMTPIIQAFRQAGYEVATPSQSAIPDNTERRVLATS